MLLDLHTGFSEGRSGDPTFLSLSEFSQFIVIHAVIGFCRVNKSEVDVFLELSHLFDDPPSFGNLNSHSSALNISKFKVHPLLNPGWENFEHCVVCEMSAIVR